MVCQDALNSLSSKIKIQIWLSLKGETVWEFRRERLWKLPCNQVVSRRNILGGFNYCHKRERFIFNLLCKALGAIS
jgi:hypothetical protein